MTASYEYYQLADPERGAQASTCREPTQHRRPALDDILVIESKAEAGALDRPQAFEPDELARHHVIDPRPTTQTPASPRITRSRTEEST